MHKMCMYTTHIQHHIMTYGNIFICFMCKCFAHVYICAPHVCLVSAEARRGNQSDPLDPTDGCEPSCGYRKSNLGPLEVHPVFLTVGPFLQSQWKHSY